MAGVGELVNNLQNTQRKTLTVIPKAIQEK
jgi:hypothetical protein